MIHELVGIKDNTAVLNSPKVAEQYRCGWGGRMTQQEPLGCGGRRDQLGAMAAAAAALGNSLARQHAGSSPEVTSPAVVCCTHACVQGGGR